MGSGQGPIVHQPPVREAPKGDSPQAGGGVGKANATPAKYAPQPIPTGWQMERRGTREGTSLSAPSAESFRRNLSIRTYRFAMMGRRERMEGDGDGRAVRWVKGTDGGGRWDGEGWRWEGEEAGRWDRRGWLFWVTNW